jgi:hypothetical protein
MTSPASTPPRCASCEAPSTGGRFCSNCGAPFAGALCASCRSALSVGARFCHRCGTAVGAVTQRDAGAGNAGTRGKLLPWAITSAALLALVGVAVSRNYRAGGGRGDPVGEAGPTSSSVTAGGSADTAETEPQAAPPMRAPDISAMSARDRADRLYDRVMRLNTEGKRDSVEFFAPMVLSAYAMAAPLDDDQHYDLGRIGQVTGVPGLAKAEADTILGAHPTHLLGLTLEAEAATAANRPAAARQFYQRLLAAEPTELRKGLPEYSRHRTDIEIAVATAKRMGVN